MEGGLSRLHIRGVSQHILFQGGRRSRFYSGLNAQMYAASRTCDEPLLSGKDLL
jgi:hypothetical protein